MTSNTQRGNSISPENIGVLFLIILGICFFVLIRNKFKFFYAPAKRLKVYPIFFGACIVWFSSIMPDMVDLLTHIYQDMPMGDRVIGAAGLNDVLFIYGFTVFVTLTVFYLLWGTLTLVLNRLFGFQKSHIEIEII